MVHEDLLGEGERAPETLASGGHPLGPAGVDALDQRRRGRAVSRPAASSAGPRGRAAGRSGRPSASPISLDIKRLTRRLSRCQDIVWSRQPAGGSRWKTRSTVWWRAGGGRCPTSTCRPSRCCPGCTRLARHLDRQRTVVFARHDLETWTFDVLSALRRSDPPHHLSPGQLLAQTLVTSGTMTNRIDHLEAAGPRPPPARPGRRPIGPGPTHRGRAAARRRRPAGPRGSRERHPRHARRHATRHAGRAAPAGRRPVRRLGALGIGS